MIETGIEVTGMTAEFISCVGGLLVKFPQRLAENVDVECTCGGDAERSVGAERWMLTVMSELMEGRSKPLEKFQLQAADRWCFG